MITGDTRPCAATIEAARGADLLVHEATFGDEEAERAVETGHSTAREAAQVAREAGRPATAAHALLGALFARRVRARSARRKRGLRSETLIGKDGMEIEVPFRDARVARLTDRRSRRQPFEATDRQQRIGPRDAHRTPIQPSERQIVAVTRAPSTWTGATSRCALRGRC